MKTNHYTCSYCLLLLFFATSSLQSVYAQEQDLEKMRASFEAFEQQTQNKFKQFADSIDQQFAQYLLDSWKTFEAVSPSISPLEEEKPSKQPIAPDLPNQSTQISSPNVIPTTSPRLNNTPKEAINLKKSKSVEYQATTVPYFGLDLPISHEAQLHLSLSSPLSASIPAAWEYLSSMDYQFILAQIAYIRQKLALNDLANWELIRRVSAEIFPYEKNEQILFTCFLLNKDGFVAKVAFDKEEQLMLLLPCQQYLYEIAFYQIGGQKFYAFSEKGRINKTAKLSSYDVEYEGAEKILNFRFQDGFKLPLAQAKRTLSFDYQEQAYELEISYNQNYVDFFKEVAPASFELTLSTPLSPSALNSFEQQIQPVLAAKSELEKVNILLAMVQKGFEYATDQDQFGYEKYFYPEELLHYPQSDCEDRSALFSCLVRDLLGLEVIGLIFPDHVATAVKFNEAVEGDFLELGAEKFIICDPTYIGASAGMCMPKYRSSKLEIVLLD